MILYHIARNEVGQQLFVNGNTFTWDGSQLNQRTLDSNNYSLRVDLNDGAGKRGMINALANRNKQDLNPIMLNALLEAVFDALVKSNGRYMEGVFEEIRKSEFPHLPSRLTCLFLSEKQDVPEWYAALITLSNPMPVVYEVEVHGNTHSGDHRWLDTDIMSLEEYQHFARSYWQGNAFASGQRSIREVLFSGSMRLLRTFKTLEEFQQKHN